MEKLTYIVKKISYFNEKSEEMVVLTTTNPDEVESYVGATPHGVDLIMAGSLVIDSY